MPIVADISLDVVDLSKISKGCLGNALKRGEAVEKLVCQHLNKLAKVRKLKGFQAGRCKGYKSQAQPFFRQSCTVIKEIRASYKVYQQHLEDIEAFPTIQEQFEAYGENYAEYMECPLTDRRIRQFERLAKRFGSDWYSHIFAAVQVDAYLVFNKQVNWVQIKERYSGTQGISIFEKYANSTLMVGQDDEWDTALRTPNFFIMVDRETGEVRWIPSGKADRNSWLFVEGRYNTDNHYEVPTSDFRPLSELFEVLSEMSDKVD